jgi:preprotein translocase subunit SecA
MIFSLARKWFGTVNDRRLAAMQPLVAQINALEPKYTDLADQEFIGLTKALKERYQILPHIDTLLPEAFAIAREATKRVLGQRHFDVQLLGGIALHQGKIAEMRTGEGKTQVAVLAAYLNALTGKGVHIVTVNDYLAKRDAEWMGKIYHFLGISVGCIVSGLSDTERQYAYACDITYSTNNELGFDYLRDNMKYSRAEMVQRAFNYAIIDEVDSILIDEARTPLIISGPTEDNSSLYASVNAIITVLGAADYEKDEKARTVSLTDAGMTHVEELLKKEDLLPEFDSLYDAEHISLVHHVNQALRAHHLFTRDVDYMVNASKVVIIDEFTGRMMAGRRYSEGLHQALEAKEDVPIQNENQTLASITFQNYFRMYPKLAGMTGTAMTEASEFSDIYRLEVLDIPTHVPVQRVDEDDEIYRTLVEKNNAILTLIKERHSVGQPILVGTVSIEKSEILSAILKQHQITHHVLNARYHAQEAQIISQAGRPGAVTIATNMAGRGTDIRLGGNLEMLIASQIDSDTAPKERKRIEKESTTNISADKDMVLAAGGLLVIATERHESRRIDNQLRGRSGRQGDPGRTKFFLSLEDDLMRIFGSDKISGVLQKLGLKEGEAIIHPWISKTLERAQQKVEARNYEIRKNLLRFDDVMNDQRKVIYEQRIELMESESVTDILHDMRLEVNESLVEKAMPSKAYSEQWDIEHLAKALEKIYNTPMDIASWAAQEGVGPEQILEKIEAACLTMLEAKENRYGPSVMREAEKRCMLITLDQLWKDHLLTLDHLRQGINLRAYGQKDPLNEYKREAFQMFQGMLHHFRELTVQRIYQLEITIEYDSGTNGLKVPFPSKDMVSTRADPMMITASDLQDAATTWGKVGRNDSCPCGSGKKFKYCHGGIAS